MGEHECEKEVEIARIQEREKQFMDALADNKLFHKEISKSLQEITSSMVMIAKQGETINALREGQERMSRAQEEIFKRLRTLELSPGQDAKVQVQQQGMDQRTHMSAVKVALISCGCSLIVALLTALFSKH